MMSLRNPTILVKKSIFKFKVKKVSNQTPSFTIDPTTTLTTSVVSFTC